MQHLRPSRLARAAVVLALSAGVASCSGSGGPEPDGDDAPGAAECRSQGSRVLSTLVDDRAALPANNWVPVVREAGDYRGRLVRLDQVTRLVSAEDVAAVAAATGEERASAVRAGVADVPQRRVGREFRLVVPQGTTSTAVGELYQAALERLGSPTTVQAAELDSVLGAVEGGEADVALVRLGALADALAADVPAEARVPEQVEAVAAAAGERRLVLGDPAEATGIPQVLAPQDVVERYGLASVSDLAEACAGGAVAATAGAESAAVDLAETYGLEVVEEPVTDPTAVFAEDASVVAVVVAGG